ncbi:MAG: Gfo/Idh/MocA family oxidoreductase [Provencibacterium sp.]|nr:Gfo/Idh/MocA family oxidoreductase [Provencibacterium sp.]
MSKPFRVAVVGMGAMGRLYAEWMQQGKVPGAVFSAAYDPDPACAGRLGKSFSQARFFSESGALFNSKLADAVIIAAPHKFHPELGEQALRAGLHTLVEKPAGIDAASVRRMNAAASERPQLGYGIMFNQRMNPLYRRIRQLVQSGEMGRLRRVTWMITTWWRPDSYYTHSPWRATWAHEGGGVLTSQAPHQLDLLQWICGMPQRVCCHMQFGSHRAVAVEDDVTAYLEFPGGATGIFISCTHDVLGTDRLELLLDGGKIFVENSQRAIVRRLHRPEQEMSASLDACQSAQLVEGGTLSDICTETVWEHTPEWAAQHCEMLTDFIASVQTGSPFAAPGEEGLNEVQLANAMYLSAWQGRTVELPADEAAFSAMLAECARREREKNCTGKE